LKLGSPLGTLLCAKYTKHPLCLSTLCRARFAPAA
jgi:hypothetical protein